MSLKKWDADEYWRSQAFETSARLHMQHWIMTYQLGYVLHPKIQLPESRPIKIADIGAGNGAWLLELAAKYPSKDQAELVGFDITSSHFAHPAFLPKNVELRTWDAWSTVPEECIGAFDVVHLRLLVSAVVNNNAGPIIENALAMLKPGGYLQWDENDPANQDYHVPEEGMEAPGARTLTTLMRVMTKAHSKILPDWLYGLAQTLREKGCEVLVEGRMEAKKELAKAWTENYLLVFKALIPTMPETPAPLPPGMGLPETLSQESFAELVKQTIDEAAKGVSLDSPFYVTVARKGS